jgi:hypothetical protein
VRQFEVLSQTKLRDVLANDDRGYSLCCVSGFCCTNDGELILGLFYSAKVVISHIVFFATNFNVPSQAVRAVSHRGPEANDFSGSLPMEGVRPVC